ncbi:MAG TPA: hypothetical protein VNF47_16395 [Streptosporangiaceae bacterium]|nr:hypothetical protein [Streptosporangiaceae bacterium]
MAGTGGTGTVGNPLAGGGPGPYGYVADNPLTNTDPSGHFCEVCDTAPAIDAELLTSLGAAYVTDGEVSGACGPAAADL